MKIREFQKQLRKKGIDAAVFYNLETNQENISMQYLANYKGYGFLVVPARKKPFLAVQMLDIEYALKSGTKFFIAKRSFIEEIIRKKLKNPKKIGIEFRNFSIFAQRRLKKSFKKAKLADISGIVEELRMRKTAKEIRIIEEASRITNRILNSCIKSFSKFSTERDVYNFLRKACIDNEVEPSFDFVVASGTSPATPHHVPQKKRLSKGFCVIDFGIRHRGYCTDVTRTVYIGKLSEKDKKIYNLVLNAQESAIKKISRGISFSELDETARKCLGKYEKKFIHALGHGLGLEVHEKPVIHSKAKGITIEDGMYFTIEPGVYFPLRFGIRIEDDILVRNGKAVNLTKVPKKLVGVKPKIFK